MSSRRHLALFAAVGAVALLTTACWRAGPVDGPGSTVSGASTDNVGNEPSVVGKQFSGTHPFYVAYHDTTNHTLKVAVSLPNQQWSFTTVDGTGGAANGATTDSVGAYVSLANAPNTPSTFPVDAFYSDSTTHRLRHAHTESNVWTAEDVDGPGAPAVTGSTTDPVGAGNAAFNFQNSTQDLYVATHTALSSPSTTRVRHAAYSAGVWSLQDVDGPGGVASGATSDNVGGGMSVATANNAVDAFYYDATTHRLRHAHYNGDLWNVSDLDGAGVAGTGRTSDDVGSSTAAVYGLDGSLHVFYYDATAGRLRHAWLVPGAPDWQFQDLDGPGTGLTDHLVGNAVAVAQNAPAGQYDVVYGDLTNHAVRHPHWNGSAWQFEWVEGLGSLTTGGTSHPVGVGNAVVYGGATVDILHVITGDTLTGDLREACSSGFGTVAPVTCRG